jgi:hypothetical protein
MADRRLHGSFDDTGQRTISDRPAMLVADQVDALDGVRFHCSE